jgi:Na+/proline symporter
VLFQRLMKAPTLTGRKLLDQIDGLRLYVGVAERDDLARQQVPPLTTEEFHRLLPYALALGVERTWTDRFAATVGPAAAAAAVAGAGWYQGSSGSMGNLGGFSSGFGSAFGPVIILSLFWRRFTYKGAIAGVICGALVDLGWLLFLSSTGIYEIVPGFCAGFLAAVIVTLLDKKPTEEVTAIYDKAMSIQ